MAALAFDHFARRQVEIAVIETGLGGRLDATNVLHPLLTIITDISYDHTEILGPTLSDIAGEKAGIIKAGVPTVIGLLPPEARRVIASTCRQRGSVLEPLKRRDFTPDLGRLRLAFRSDGLQFPSLTPSLKGPHQLRNTALVLKASEVLRRSGLSLSKTAVKRGVEQAVWPGRFQILRNGRHSPTVLLDVCHNRGGATAFADTYRRVFPGRPAQTIIGFARGKAHQEMIDQLARMTRQFWLVPLASSRSVDVKELERSLDWHGIPVRRFAHLETAYKQVLMDTGSDGIIAVIGSHYLVGEYLEKFGRD